METGFDDTGIRILRGALTEAEIDRLAAPIRAAFSAGDYDGFNKDSAYPLPGVYSMGPGNVPLLETLRRIGRARDNILRCYDSWTTEQAHQTAVTSMKHLFGLALVDAIQLDRYVHPDRWWDH